MKYRKHFFKKLVCLVTVVMFMCQCATVRKGALLDTQKNIDESKIAGYEYRIDQIKAPTTQDFTAEYKIVKLPMHNMVETRTYKGVKKYNSTIIATVLVLAGVILGGGYGAEHVVDEDREEQYITKCALLGGLGGAVVSYIFTRIANNRAAKDEVDPVKEHKNYTITKPGSTPIPFENQPVEIQWYSGGKIQTFKTFSDNDGIIKINLTGDLKINVNEFSTGKRFSLVIFYINAETGKKVSTSILL
jgi:hypothetical protein